MSSIPNTILKRYVMSTFCAFDRVGLVCGTCQADSLKALTRGKRGNDIYLPVGPLNNCHTEKTGKVSCEKMTINYFIVFPTAVFPGHKICQRRNINHRLR